jgi:class 3 adenylate cyclase/TolB-like protein
LRTVPPARRLAAVCFADIVGYTELSSRDEGAALQLVALLKEVAGREVADRGGRIVKHLGDAVLAEFPGVEGALEAALALTAGYCEATRAAGSESRLRSGLHAGEATFSPDGDVYGDVVNVAARLQAAAEPGQVLVSEDVVRQLRRRPSFTFLDGGARNLKGLPEPIPTFVAERRYVPSEPTDPGDPTASVRVAAAHCCKRLAVLPFRILRVDPEIDFLAFALADAVASSLVGIPGVAIRSTAGVLRYAGLDVDPGAVAREADLDLIVTGTLLRVGDRVRVTVQLSEGREGTLKWTEAATVGAQDLFQLQDDLAERVVSSLSVSLGGAGCVVPERDVPASPHAYELFLRANSSSIAYGDWRGGADLYGAALQEDPNFAPAWARLGRCYRLLGKYDATGQTGTHMAKAGEAFARAISLNPGLALAQSLMAQHEVEAGRCVDGMLRLLERLQAGGESVEIYVGLTHALRYCGLLAESLRAHELAVELDPGAVTSVAFTHLARGDHGAALAAGYPSDFSAPHALLLMSRGQEALVALEAFAPEASGALLEYCRALMGFSQGRGPARDATYARIFLEFPDPEARYLIGAHWSRLGAHEEALQLLRGVVDGGYYCVEALQNEGAFEGLRSEPEFGALLERAESGRTAARQAFLARGGARWLRGSAPIGGSQSGCAA